MDLTQMLAPEFALIAAFLYGLGAALKKLPRFPDWGIPLALLICGICL